MVEGGGLVVEIKSRMIVFSRFLMCDRVWMAEGGGLVAESEIFWEEWIRV